jgi:LDH2 family malate/lactate/ureidoglycolate dehydrogenase
MESAPSQGKNATSGTNPIAGASDTKPKVFDKEGAVGKQFTGM